MKNLFIILCLVFSINVYAESLQSSDSKLIDAAGIPIYPGAVFVQGNKDLGYRFASNTPPEKVQDWYRQKLPKWALFNEYGGWILHDGEAGINMGEVLSRNQISVQQNDNLPQWHAIDKTMTTEIVIMIVR
jgi:hypothetical protein